jgi:hypothetical protein
MTGLTHTFSNDAAELARKGYSSWVGNTIFQIADVDNTSVDAIGVEGWQIIGRVTGFGLSRAQEVLPIRTGTPETLKNNIIIGDNFEIGITFDHPTLMGFKLANGSNYTTTVNYASDGQTTVATATSRTVTVVQAGLGAEFAAGDMVEVDVTDATYGGFKEIVYVVSVATDTITHTRLVADTAVGKSFKKVAGWDTGATAASDGIQLFVGNTCAPSYKARLVTYMTCPSRVIHVYYFPELQIINPVPFNLDDPKALITAGFTGSAIAQTSDTALSGNTAVPYLAQQFILPYDSD